MKRKPEKCPICGTILDIVQKDFESVLISPRYYVICWKCTKAGPIEGSKEEALKMFFKRLEKE